MDALIVASAKGSPLALGEQISLLVFMIIYSKGAAVLLASSDLPEVLRLAHRIVVLRQGRVVAELDGRTGTEEEIVALATGAARSAARTERHQLEMGEAACVA